ncbi:MAG TPA: hypothetical protein VND93_14935, partial [Myxococcales bacterium]|nr:hypothetical protein [Myxococcales bacterium]
MAIEKMHPELQEQAQANKEIYGRDPIARFEKMVATSAIELDLRDDDQLVADARNHPDAIVREHSLYQLMHRRGAAALPVLEERLMEERDSATRVNLLWLLQEVPSERCKKLALSFIDDKDHRVREWARVFTWEMGWTTEDFRRARSATYDATKQFDETVFLHIKCHLYTRLSASNDMWGHVYMSPQMLARVYGQA